MEELAAITDPEELKNEETWKNLFSKVYKRTDDSMKDKVPGHHGCTAVTCLIDGENESRRLIVANVGDARAVLWYKKKIFQNKSFCFILINFLKVAMEKQFD